MDEEVRPSGLKRTAKFLFSALTSVCLASSALVAATALQYGHDLNRNVPVKIGSELKISASEFALNSPGGHSLRPVRVAAVKVSAPVIIAQAEVEQVFEFASEVASPAIGVAADERSIHALLSRRFEEITLLSEPAPPIEGEMDRGGILEVLSSAAKSADPIGPVAVAAANQAVDIQKLESNPSEYSNHLRADVSSHYKDPVVRVEIPRIISAKTVQNENIQPAKKTPAQHVSARDASVVRELVLREESAKNSQILDNQTKHQTKLSGVSKDVVSDHAEKLVTLQAAYLAMNAQTTQKDSQRTPTFKDYVMDQGGGYPQGSPAPPPPVPPKNNEKTPDNILKTTHYDISDPGVQGGFRGKILEGFAGGKRVVVGAEAQVLGTSVVVESDANGEFEFKNVSVKGVLPILISKKGYLMRRGELKEGVAASFELVSENAVAISAVVAGETRAEGTGFVFGELTTADASSLAGKRIEVGGPADVMRVYLNERGIPDKALTATSSRGQFVLLNVRPGTYLISILDERGQERAPHVIYVGAEEGILRGFDLGTKMTIRGRVLNAAANAPVEQAQVQFLGNSMVSTADRTGRYSLGPVYVDCGENNYLQVDRSGYYRNRLDFNCVNSNPELYVFPAGYIDQLGVEAKAVLKADKGVVVGNVSFRQSVKMQLWGPEEKSVLNGLRGKDFYFDHDGVLNSTRNRTTSNGNFTILDAPDGLSYIQAFSKDEKTLSYWPILLSPSTVNVYRQ
ncbi:MAG: hypothetical protein HYW49_05190 [Deltaproteobacteria bacterium]|nr:hypothetical protein [Deltaproteobacteria bacterium]